MAEFADLENDDGALFHEYGIPHRVTFISLIAPWRYPLWARANIMHRIWACSEGRQGGDDLPMCRVAARYVRDQLCDCNARTMRGATRNYHSPRCEFIRVASWAYHEEPQR